MHARRTSLGHGLMGLALISLGVLTSQPSQAQTSEINTAVRNAGPGGKGAQIYCAMRSSGNSHQVSWDAAYALIKRQSDKLFKTSPEHAAVMITEAVVQNPNVYPDCSRFLGDLFKKPDPAAETGKSNSPSPSGTSRSERLDP